MVAQVQLLNVLAWKGISAGSDFWIYLAKKLII